MSAAPKMIKARFNVYDDGTYAIGAYLTNSPVLEDEKYARYRRADIPWLPEDLVARGRTLLDSHWNSDAEQACVDGLVYIRDILNALKEGEK